MLKRVKWAIFVAGSVLLATVAAPVWSGGWAVATLEQLPQNVVAGQPVDIEITLRRHGQELTNDGELIIQAVHAASRRQFESRVPFTGRDGHYATTISFPETGVWQWNLYSNWFPAAQPLPDLVVRDAANAPVLAPAAEADTTVARSVGMIGLVGVLVGVVALWRAKGSWAAVLLMGSLMVGGLGFALASNVSAGQTAASVVTTDYATPADEGYALFIAKGCVVCHSHEKVNELRRQLQLSARESFGPNLTSFSADSGYLRQWLMNPASVKPQTMMPALGLSDAEIESLMAFLLNP